MRYIKQLAVILSVTFLAEGLHYYIPLPIPASIYGLVLMLIALITRLIRLEHIKDVSAFLIAIMPILFITPCVGIIDVWDQIKASLLPFLIILSISNLCTIAATGWTAQAFAKRREQK
ncbi:MAG: CidA/LrgA family protein [Clostridia bacterium]|nr:CidA/LrgA family protein [Clostridia bacterium]